MNTKLFIFIVLFCVADVATLLGLARYIGIPATLFVVLCSTVVGLLACARWTHRLSEHHEQLTAEAKGLPADVALIHGSEGLLAILAVLLFLYPGLLSDAFGFLLALPRVSEGSTNAVVRYLKELAAKEGKSVHQLFCG